MCKETFHPQIFTREDVKTAIKGNPHADNIMRYIDMLLNSGKEYQGALELACDNGECPLDYDFCIHPELMLTDDGYCQRDKEGNKHLCMAEYYLIKAQEATDDPKPTQKD